MLDYRVFWDFLAPPAHAVIWQLRGGGHQNPLHYLLHFEVASQTIIAGSIFTQFSFYKKLVLKFFSELELSGLYNVQIF